MTDSSLDALFRLCRRDLQLFFRGRTGSADLAADLTQETFLRMLRPDPPPNSRAYLFRIARNVLIDHYRASVRSRQTELSDEDWGALPDSSPSPETAVLSREELRIVDQAIQALPPRGREVFELYKFEHMSYEQIAERLGISKNTVMVHLARSLAHCKRQLEQYNDREDHDESS